MVILCFYLLQDIIAEKNSYMQERTDFIGHPLRIKKMHGIWT